MYLVAVPDVVGCHAAGVGHHDALFGPVRHWAGVGLYQTLQLNLSVQRGGHQLAWHVELRRNCDKINNYAASGVCFQYDDE